MSTLPTKDPIRGSQTVQSGGNEIRFKSETLGAELINMMFIRVLSNGNLSMKNWLTLRVKHQGVMCNSGCVLDIFTYG